VKFAGIELRNFRSIGAQPVLLTPWRKCNILIGQNNSGKSNAIRAVQRISGVFTKGRTSRSDDAQSGLVDLDSHRRSPESVFGFRLHFELNDSEDSDLADLIGSSPCYFDFSWVNGEHEPQVVDHTLAHIEDFNRANSLLELLVGQHFTSRVNAKMISDTFLKHSNGIWMNFRGAVPLVYVIPEFRQIRPGDEYTLDGARLIGLLRSWQHPDIGRDEDRDKFDRVEHFVGRLLHLPEATLEITDDEPIIVLTNDGLRLPLSSYGTGVHELVVLVTAVLSIEDAIVCIEEPEIHLHPRLQREFITFITTETNNQYLISTHSPTFINAANDQNDVQVFHLRVRQGATTGGPVLTDEDGLTALHDLGVKASDLLQANCILWVEGPSDRTYLRRWLTLVAPELVEGLDYSIMFYGGRLLSHLSADREKVPGELIEVLRINQNAVVVMDSDRDSRSDSINETKKRVAEECERSGGLCWVTDGREVENYLSERVVVAVCEELFGMGIEISIGHYDRFEDCLRQALEAAGAKNLNYATRKVKYAREFARRLELDDLDDQLKARIGEVVNRIVAWNE